MNGRHAGAGDGWRVRVVDVREADAPLGEPPIHRRPMTMHEIGDLAQAIRSSASIVRAGTAP